eukprot:6215405-Karenia_brevis.AAC.1
MEQSFRDAEAALQRRHQEDLKKKTQEEQARMIATVCVFEEFQRDETRSLQSKHEKQRMELQAKHMKEIYTPLLRVSGSQLSFLNGCYKLDTCVSSDAAP